MDRERRRERESKRGALVLLEYIWQKESLFFIPYWLNSLRINAEFLLVPNREHLTLY